MTLQDRLDKIGCPGAPYNFDGNLVVSVYLCGGLSAIFRLGMLFQDREYPEPRGRIHIVGGSTDECYQAFWPDESWREE